MFCSECGKQVADDAKFCGECGATQLNSDQPVNNPKTDDSLTSNITTTSVNDPLAYFKAIGAIIVVVILASYFVFSTKEDTSNVNASEDTQAVTQTAERENTVGKAEQDQLRSEAGAGNRAYYSSSTQNFLEGHEYHYYSDGSCTKDCLTKAEAMQACNQVKGYANRLLKSLAITSTSKDKALLEGGDVTNFSATWTGTNCYASLTIKGIYEGSSARTNIGGSVGTFVYSSGEILVYYIDTLG